MTRQLMRSYIDLLNESKDATNQTQLVENSSYQPEPEEIDLFQDIIKITNFPWRKALELLKDTVRVIGPFNAKFSGRLLLPHEDLRYGRDSTYEYLRYGRNSLIDYTKTLVRLKKAASNIINTLILDGERTAAGGHENFFLKDEEIIFMTIVLCREIKTLVGDPRVASINNRTFAPDFNVKEFADDSEERLEDIYDLAQKVYKAMQRRLQDATEVISERRKKVDEMIGFRRKKTDPFNDEMAQVLDRLGEIERQDMSLKPSFQSFIDELPEMAKLVNQFYKKPQHFMTQDERFKRRDEILAAIEQARTLGLSALELRPISYNFNKVKNEIMSNLNKVIRLKEPEPKPTPLGSVIDHQPISSVPLKISN